MTASFRVQPSRYQEKNTKTFGAHGPVVYWMSREMRLADNWALLHAQDLAKEHGRSLCIVYNIVPNYLGGGRRQWEFKKAALQELEEAAHEKGIAFFVIVGEEKELHAWIVEQKAACVVTDFCPLAQTQRWVRVLAKQLDVPVIEVDAHNIVPCWVASQKQEFGAYTLRPKIHRLLNQYLEPFPRLLSMEHKIHAKKTVWKNIEVHVKIDESIIPVTWITSGEHAAHVALRVWVREGIAGYNERRNDPNAQGQSNLSPYLHYGMLAPQRVALEVRESHVPRADKDAFLEELIVRRELADNFCFYNANYQTPEGFPAWAQKTLAEHAKDAREYTYTLREFREGRTHDELWNAAQREMVTTGKMHGYMRMYWAKKILEWTKSPAEAMHIAIALNDAYELDGRDPNGYAGIAWSIGGVHDRAWFDRPVFGKIRYMNMNGAKKKFDVAKYMQAFPPQQKTE